MMNLLLKNGAIVTGDKEFSGDILIKNGGIQKIGGTISDRTAEVCDLGGRIVIPAFIDIHIHGADGADTMDNSLESLKKISAFAARHGVANFLPTTLTGPQDVLMEVLEKIADLQDTDLPGANIFGVHMEGPYFDMEYKGAQNAKYIKVSTVNEIKKFLRVKKNLVKLFSLSPNNEEALESIRFLREKGVVVSVGHSACVYEKVKKGIEAGIRHATHTFNGMRGFNHREPGVVGAILEDPAVKAEIIFDKIHVHPAMVHLLIKIKGVENVICITDSMSAAGLSDGDYKLGELDVYVKDGVVRLATYDSLAGSILTMDSAFRNLLELGWSMADAIRMTSTNAAEEFGLNSGEIAPGKDADLTVLDNHNEVVMTVVKGRIKYKGI
ncbi:MAG: N-acetylglucosamine-6-phosphate deacetylase [Fusobacteriaceae bacterium]|nr:N-acetylglucosamine-6-phosphate deacetylase [Fusobacteriaceae bacterium]